MALVGVSQYNHHHQQIDEYEYDDTDNFYDDGANFGNYLDVDDSEGKRAKAASKFTKKFAEIQSPNKCFTVQNSNKKHSKIVFFIRLFNLQIQKRPVNRSTGTQDDRKMNRSK